VRYVGCTEVRELGPLPIVGKPDSYALRAEAVLRWPQVISFAFRVLTMARSVTGFIAMRRVGAIRTHTAASAGANLLASV
jgi:hypothetical protein